MGKKQKATRRGTFLPHPPIRSQEELDRLGIITVGRQEALIRQIDTAIRMWFVEEEPMSIHLIVMAAWDVLRQLGFPPFVEAEIDTAAALTVYDFQRHVAEGKPTEVVAFTPLTNSGLIYGVVLSFGEAYGGKTARMRVFEAYFPVALLDWSEVRDAPKVRESLAQSMPKVLPFEEAIAIGRIESFNRLFAIFDSDGRSLALPDLIPRP